LNLSNKFKLTVRGMPPHRKAVKRCRQYVATP